MAARRGSGEGGIYQRADGMWCATVELGRTPEGTRKRKVVKARTKAALMVKLEAQRGSVPGMKAKVEAGKPTAIARMTTKQYLDWWLDEVMAARVRAGTLKASTLAAYRQQVDLYVVPAIGLVPLHLLGPEHVHVMLRAMEDKPVVKVVDGKKVESRGLSVTVIRQTRAILHGALKHAEKWEKIDRNPVPLVDGPRGQSFRISDALTAEEARKVLAAVDGNRLQALASLILRLGLRKGEAMALRWPNIDLDGGVVRVERTRSRVRKIGMVESTAKTIASARTIPLPASVLADLKAHKRRQAKERLALGSAWRGEDFVFTTAKGCPLDPRNTLDWWHEVTTRAGVGRRRMHAARHTAATLLLDQGVPLEVVSAILGHAGLAITADVYARPTMDAKRRALDAVDALG